MIQIGRYITRKEVAERLGISISTLDRLRKNDPDFPTGVKISKRSIRISLKELRNYIDSRS